MNTYTAFVGHRLLKRGTQREVALAVHGVPSAETQPLVFEDATGKQLDFDTRGSRDEVAARYSEDAPKVGRPKLGVVGREVTLLERHWHWLESQQGGASATLRRLVDEARKTAGNDRANRDACYRFLSAMAGNQPDFEEATRALYRGEYDAMRELMQGWPKDVKEHALRLLTDSPGQ